MVAALWMMCSCSSENLENGEVEKVIPVTVCVEGFVVSQEEIPSNRATAVASYNDVKALTLVFYKTDGSQQYSNTQLRDDQMTYTTFGEFSTSLPVGTYTMVVMGYHDTSAISLTGSTSASFSNGFAHDTFWAKQTVTVTDHASLHLSATLNRIVSMLGVVSTDQRPANVTAVRMTLTKGDNSFSPLTGLAVNEAGVVNTASVSAQNSTTQVGTYLFLNTDEQSMNVTIETLDANNQVLYSKTVADVPFKRNRRTLLTGALYSASASVSGMQVATEWIDNYNVNF